MMVKIMVAVLIVATVGVLTVAVLWRSVRTANAKLDEIIERMLKEL